MTEEQTPSASAVILAGGKGKRAGFGKDKPKQFRRLCGKPLLAYSLEVFEKCENIKQIVVVAPRGHMEKVREIAKKSGIKKASVTRGGQTRFESARLGFLKTPPDSRTVVFHDAARPFVSRADITSCICAACRFGAASLAIPLDDAIKKTDEKSFQKTVCRSGVWRVQTPQAFQRKLLLQAYKNFSGSPSDITDEAALFEQTKQTVAVVEGRRLNMKITTPGDFAIAEAVAEAVKSGKLRGAETGK